MIRYTSLFRAIEPVQAVTEVVLRAQQQRQQQRASTAGQSDVQLSVNDTAAGPDDDDD